MKYEFEMCHRSYFPDNIKHWQVFEDGTHTKWFHELVEELSVISIDLGDEEEDADLLHADQMGIP